MRSWAKQDIPQKEESEREKRREKRRETNAPSPERKAEIKERRGG